MKTVILPNGDMVITIPKEEKEIQLQHLNSLEPTDRVQFDEITVLMDIVNQSKKDCKPIVNLRLIKGGTS
jgi:hypothetical protein